MTSVSEIKLAKERLALAKANEESASKRLSKSKATKKQVMETLTEDVDDAQKQFETSQRDIQLAKERLASAEAQNKIVFKWLDKVKKQAAKMSEALSVDVDDAQEHYESSKSEVDKATACLKAAENSREVITIDSDSDEEQGNSKKKTPCKDKVVKKEVKDEDTGTVDEEQVSKKMKVSTKEKAKDKDLAEEEVNFEGNNEEAASEDSEDEDNVNQVVVMGCGSAEVNGVYKLTEDLDVLEPFGNYKSVYVKQGVWGKEKDGNFFLLKEEGECWQIVFRQLRSRYNTLCRIYETKDPQFIHLPPKDGWVASINCDGDSPPPTLQYQASPRSKDESKSTRQGIGSTVDHFPQAKSPTMSWKDLWSQMRGAGWVYCPGKRGRGNHQLWVHPSAAKMTKRDMIRDCTEGVHYFSSEKAIQQYAIANLGWKGEDGTRRGKKRQSNTDDTATSSSSKKSSRSSKAQKRKSSGSRSRARGAFEIEAKAKRMVNEVMTQDSVDDSLMREVLRQTIQLPSRSNYGM